MPKPSYTFLRNPMTGVCKAVRSSDPETRRLLRYGWEYATRADYKAWQVANVKADRALRAAAGQVRH